MAKKEYPKKVKNHWIGVTIISRYLPMFYPFIKIFLPKKGGGKEEQEININ